MGTAAGAGRAGRASRARGPAIALRRLLARDVRVRRHKPRASAPSAEPGPRRIYILPTRAGLGYAAILLAMLLGALNYQNNLALFLTFTMIGATVVSMHHCWFHLLKLRLSARDGQPVFQGQTARFPVRVQELAHKARPALCVRGGGCLDLDADGAAEIQLGRPAGKRGLLPLGTVTLETRYPLGLFRAWTQPRLSASVLVYPRPAPKAPPPGLEPAGEQRTGRGGQGAGNEDFIGPRGYCHGDSPRRVDWKAYARERGLVVKQFGAERPARLSIDWHQLGPADTEQRLALLTRQVLDAHARGATYGLRLPGVDIAAQRGEQHKHLCLAALARYGNGAHPDAGEAHHA